MLIEPRVIRVDVGHLIKIIRNMLQERISQEVFQAKYYSIQVDSTQDISSIDQFCIIIRYVLKLHNAHTQQKCPFPI